LFEKWAIAFLLISKVIIERTCDDVHSGTGNSMKIENKV